MKIIKTNKKTSLRPLLPSKIIILITITIITIMMMKIFKPNRNHVTDLYYPHHPAFPFLAAAAAGLKHHDYN